MAQSAALTFASPLRIRVTALGVLSFLVGITASYKVILLGELYLAELLLPLAGGAALFTRGATSILRVPLFRTLLSAMLVTFAGYVLSDLVRGSSADQYLRGWARVAVLATNFVSLCLLVGADRRNLWWYVLGTGVGGVLYLRLAFGLPLPVWKHGYAEYMTPAVVAASALLPAYLVVPAHLWLAWLSIRWDYRSHALIMILICALLWLRGRRQVPAVAMKAALALALVGVLVAAGLDFSASEYERGRREASNVGRSFGLMFGAEAILNSPLVGYGSWAKGEELTELASEVLDRELGKKADAYSAGQQGSASIHSQLLQSWVEGGVLGAVFFLVLGYQLLKWFPELAFRRPRDALTPILLLYTLSGVWHLLLSPFALGGRLLGALACSSLVLVALEKRARK